MDSSVEEKQTNMLPIPPAHERGDVLASMDGIYIDVPIDEGPVADGSKSVLTDLSQSETHHKNQHGESVGNCSSSRFWKTFLLAYQTMGVVYAGIGTCPLYVFSSFKLDKPTENDYLGVMSIVFWTLTLISLVKYGLIVLRADDHGEGGTFALYSLLCQYVNISRDGRASKKIQASPPKPGSRRDKVIKFLEGSQTSKVLLFTVTMMGACMLIGDGILTPAISVLSAVEGLKNASSSITQSTIVIVTAVLLIALFLLQRFGTNRVSFVFSPIIVAWFVATPLIGAYNIALYYPTVFKAISPHYIVAFFLRRGMEGWKVLAGTVLCITGSEAMYADLGHFDRLSMQVAFAFFAYPSNLITYAGQAAYLIKYPDSEGEVFYNFIPRPVFWPMFIIATLSAIIASQCLISACFSLVKQSVALDLFPKVRILHTSKNHEGQVYSPEVNYFLMIVCVLVVLGYRDATALGNAYGVAVIMVMLITTCFVSLVMVVVWETALPFVIAFFLAYGIFEGVYVSAVLSKVPQGGWLPFLVAAFIGFIMFSWTYGREKHYAYEKANTIRVDDLGDFLTTSNIKRVPGLCIFYCDLEDDLPPLMMHYLKNVRSLHQVIIFTSVRYVKVPKVSEDQRFKFSNCGGYNGLYRCVAFYGYAEENIEWNEFLDRVVDSLKMYIKSSSSELHVAAKEDQSPPRNGFAEDLVEIEGAKKEGPVMVVGKTRLVTRRKGLKFWFRKVILDFIYRFLYSNSTTTAASLTLTVPPSNLMEISMLYEV